MVFNICVSCRVSREKKERRRKLAQRLTPRPSKKVKGSQDVSETKTEQASTEELNFLPDNIVQMIAAEAMYGISFLLKTNMHGCLYNITHKRAIIHLQTSTRFG